MSVTVSIDEFFMQFTPEIEQPLIMRLRLTHPNSRRVIDMTRLIYDIFIVVLQPPSLNSSVILTIPLEGL